MQEEMNRHMMLLLTKSSRSQPELSSEALTLNELSVLGDKDVACHTSFRDVWVKFEDDGSGVNETARKRPALLAAKTVPLQGKTPNKPWRSRGVKSASASGAGAKPEKTSQSNAPPPPLLPAELADAPKGHGGSRGQESGGRGPAARPLGAPNGSLEQGRQQEVAGLSPKQVDVQLPDAKAQRGGGLTRFGSITVDASPASPSSLQGGSTGTLFGASSRARE
mmetsp:Transcript_2541/g.8512  ORF Transcript_2541/g.8512 Transcript_2541/m.8512 type:complete len:222 (+) Transcript_2541:1-666(+)